MPLCISQGLSVWGLIWGLREIFLSATLMIEGFFEFLLAMLGKVFENFGTLRLIPYCGYEMALTLLTYRCSQNMDLDCAVSSKYLLNFSTGNV